MPFHEGKAQAHRCTNCGIQFPLEIEVCPICDNPKLWNIYKTGPDPDWKERVEAVTGASLGTEIAFTYPHKPDVTVALHISDGRMWIPHRFLIEDGGYINLEAGSIVFVNNRFYELQGRNKRQGDMWWVEELVIDGIFDNVTPEDIINGGWDG